MSMVTAPVQEQTNVAAAAARMMTSAEATVETLFGTESRPFMDCRVLTTTICSPLFIACAIACVLFIPGMNRPRDTWPWARLWLRVSRKSAQSMPGPGLLNVGAALLTAYGMNVPLVALVGQIPQPHIDRGHGWLHEIRDQVGMARHFSKFAARIRAPHEAPQIVAEARPVTGLLRTLGPGCAGVCDGHMGQERLSPNS